jgi:hypothetical protein
MKSGDLVQDNYFISRKIPKPPLILQVTEVGSFSASPSVAAIGVDHKLEGFSDILQSANQLQGVLHVNVIVHFSVDNEQFPNKSIGMVHRDPAS